jgi:uncharacterized protein YbcI
MAGRKSGQRMSQERAPRGEAGVMLAGITREIVRLHAAHYGKGPTRARSYINGEVLFCLMQDTLTPAERTLVERGKGDAVHTMRRAFQDAMAGEFTALVEEHTGRRVRAFMSQVHLDPEVDVEIFVLEPSAENAG